MNKKLTVTLHITVWVIVAILPYFLHYPLERNQEKSPPFSHFIGFNIFVTGWWAAIFYFNAIKLVPVLIYKKHYIRYALAVMTMFAIAIIAHRTLFMWLDRHRPFETARAIAFNLVPFLLTLAVSSVYKMLRDHARTQGQLQQQQQETMKTELSFLRSQVSPHFLFNVLNNMLALARFKSDELEPTIFKLSSMMRYMIYETNEDNVPLEKEVEYLRNYIDLQKQRISPEVDVKATFTIEQPNLHIAPMLLIPFIENAFKHVLVSAKNAAIEIALTARKEQLSFSVRNTQEKNSQELRDKTPGIGLPNVKRRLNLLYPQRHRLTIDDGGEWFFVDLHINLTT